ncbi:MAG: APC family permease [Acidobacteriaceae bacterium]
MSSVDLAVPSGHGLRRQLELRDLVLAQILYVVGGGWVGVAAGLGRGQAVTWVAAMLIFFFPMAAVVICLNREMPLEGGLYVWAHKAFGSTLGFLTAWNLLVYGVMNAAVILYEVPTGIAYLIGPRAAWIPESHLTSLAIIGSIIAFIAIAAARGLGFGKWIQNLGGIALVVLYAMLFGLPIWALLHHSAASPISLDGLAIAVPIINLHTLALFGQMLFGALCGLEYVAILAGESLHPARNIGRSVWIASPIICAMFILGTASVVAFRGHAATIDLIAPIPQTLRLALGPGGFGGLLAMVAILLLQLRLLGASSLTFTALTRLPMAAGWNYLVPEWFTRLDPTRRTPINSIICAAVLVFAVDFLAGLGVRAQEAFQVIVNASTASYALAYLAMFAIPIAGMVALRERLPKWLKWVAGVGFCATVFSLLISTYPIVDVAKPKAFATKLIVTTLFSNTLGLGYLKLRSRWLARRGSLAAPATKESSVKIT